MATRKVLEVQCDRCKKVTVMPVPKEDTKASYALEMKFLGETIRYEDLCSTCEKTIKNYRDRIVKKDTPGKKSKKVTPPPDKQKAQE